MTLEEQLKREILERYKSIREFSAMTGIPYSTVDSVLKRGIKNSGVGTVIRIFSFLDIDVESIPSETLKHLNTSVETKNSLSADESTPGEEQAEVDPLRSSLLHNFDQLNQEGRERLVETSDDMVSSKKYIKSDTDKLGNEKYA